MTPFPLALESNFGHLGAMLVYLIIGVGFGAVLEMSGFGKSTKLAAQFYFKDMTVLKVMFGAIIVAMVLIFITTGLGLLDYNLIWVNPTYLVPGIVGGLIMGFGFIIGGFCPGTSLVSAVTGKLDGIIFVLGVLFGIFMFGETVGGFDKWWNSSYMGRFTLMDLFQTSTGVVVVGVVIMALVAFFFAEQGERIFGKMNLKLAPRWRYGAAAGVLVLAFAAMLIGQPTTQAKWERMSATQQARLDNREVQIDPAELLKVMHNARINLVMLDVRSESDYNRFHILDAQRMPIEAIPAQLGELHKLPYNTAFVVMSNDETAATEAWKVLVAESVPNVFILSGGINNWVTTFGDDTFKADHPLLAEATNDTCVYTFSGAYGSRYAPADPSPDVFKDLTFTEKVIISGARGAKTGGCG